MQLISDSTQKGLHIPIFCIIILYVLRILIFLEGNDQSMETAYQKVKVHNELEWCQVKDMDTKEKIEKVLLKHRVSYFVKWEKPKLFSNDTFGSCVFCVNQLQKEIADDALQDLDEEVREKIRFVNRKVDKTFY